MRSLLAVSIMACGISGVRADDGKPATSNVPRAQYPRIEADQKITFRLKRLRPRASNCSRAGPTMASARAPTRCSARKMGPGRSAFRRRYLAFITTGWSSTALP